MNVIVGSARIDERGKLSGGAAGDQKQTSKPDKAGEVSMQPFYIHPKGWIIIRFKKDKYATAAAKLMKVACNNPNIGYDQNQRTSILAEGVNSKVKVETDCSTLVREIVKEVTGKDPGNFTTSNEVTVLKSTGYFTTHTYTKGDKLYEGDILVTMTKGHTVIVTDGYSRDTTEAPTKKIVMKYKVTAKSGLNVRVKPSVMEAKVSVMPYGSTFEVDKIKDDWAHGTYKTCTGWAVLKWLKRS